MKLLALEEVGASEVYLMFRLAAQKYLSGKLVWGELAALAKELVEYVKTLDDQDSCDCLKLMEQVSQVDGEVIKTSELNNQLSAWCQS